MKIGFLTRGLHENGSSRVRVLQYLKPLEQNGHRVRVLPRPRRGLPLHGRYLIRAFRLATWADLLFLQKPNQSRMLLDALHKLNGRFVVDIDDAVWSPVPGKSGPRIIRTSKRFKHRLIHAMRRADSVITGSQYLSKAVKKFCPKAEVTILPPSVDLEMYRTIRKSVNRGPLTVGWIGSSGNLPDLLQVEGALKSICASKQARLLVVSDAPPTALLPFEFQHWSLETEMKSLSRFDIGIMPLADNVRSRGRCGYKAIQYMATGIPVVSSPVGGGKEVVEDGVTGFHASSLTEWETRLLTLMNNEELRQSFGENGQKRVARYYSIQSNLPRLIEVLSRTALRS